MVTNVLVVPIIIYRYLYCHLYYRQYISNLLMSVVIPDALDVDVVLDILLCLSLNTLFVINYLFVIYVWYYTESIEANSREDHLV